MRARSTSLQRAVLSSDDDRIGPPTLLVQIADDLLDVEGSVEEVGKAVNKDAEAGKATFVSILGAERARAQANRLADQAIAHLSFFGDKAKLLWQAARFVVERKS